MLLSDGRIIYYGAADKSLEFFGKENLLCEDNYNPADFLLDIVSSQKPEDLEKLANAYQRSETNKEMNRSSVNPDIGRRTSLNETQKYATGEVHYMFGLFKSKYASPIWLQIAVLTYRNLINNYRNPYVFRTMYAVTILVGLILGNIFWKVEPNLSGIQNRAGSLFFMVVLISFSSVTGILTFHEERSVFVRERASGMYSTFSYFVAKVLADFIPMRVIPPVFLITVVYYMIGFNPAQGRFANCLLAFILVSMAAGSMSFLVSAAFKDLSLANLVAMLLLLFYLLFGGLLLNNETVPQIVGWLNLLSFINYALEILMVNEISGLTIFFDPKDIASADVVIPVNGKIFLDNFNFSGENWDRDFIMLFVWIMIYLFLAYLCLKFIVKEQR